MSVSKLRKSPPRKRGLFVERLENRLVLDSGLLFAALPTTAAETLTDATGDFYLPPQVGLGNPGALLTGPSDGDPMQLALDFLTGHAADLHLNPTDLHDYLVSDRYTDAASGVTHIYLRQTHQGLEIMNADVSISITARGEVINATSSFVADPHVSLSQPAISAPQAFTALGADLGSDLKADLQVAGSDDASGRLVLVPTHDGLELAWRLDVHAADYSLWWDAFVNAETGETMYVNDRIGHATYTVFAPPVHSPLAGSRSIVNDPQDAIASPFGWHDTNGIAGAEFTDTRGNNATAQEDANADDANGFRPSGGAGLNFNFPLDTSQDPATYQSASITNAFYWVNMLHDIHYQYGFTEAAGNFQVNNYGRGGAGNDPILIDVQDSAAVGGGGFATLPDGQSPRMTMQRWNSPYRDGSLDSDILIHEFGHGISERLTGGPSNTTALNAKQSRAMSEGWGDWWALMLTQTPADAKLDAYGIGNYIAAFPANGPGIRLYPYSFDMAINPLTYNSYNGGAANNESHAAGAIWASTLWDMNWLLIDDHGFSADMLHGNGGNNLALQLVMDGLKLQGTNPSFLAGRDAILAADVALTGGQNQTTIWTAFARRGMGYSASDGGGAGATTVVAAFDVPASIRGKVFRDDDLNGMQNGAEPGLAGWTVYRDKNNNGVLDVPTTVNFDSTDTPKPIPDAPNILSTRSVSGLTGVITDINLTVNLIHPNVGDLYLTLISPNNTPIILANYLGGSGDNYTNTVFDDEAATSISTASAPFTGSFRPYFNLSQLDGRDPNGTWKLRMDDGAAGNTGTLLNWSMQISYGDPDPTTATDAAGNYSFFGLGDGAYHVREVLKPGFTRTNPASGVYDVVLVGGQPVTERNFGYRAAATVASGSTMQNTLSSALVINPTAGQGITHFKISGILGGTLYQADGTTPINNGAFITVAQGQAGVRFLPTAGSIAQGAFDVELSQNGSDVVTGASKATGLITVTLGTQHVTSFSPTSTGARFTLSHATAIGDVLNLYDYRNPAGQTVLGAADVQLVGATSGAIAGSLVVEPADSGFTFVSTNGILPPDNYTLTLRSAANGFQTVGGELLDGNADGFAGGDFVTSFTVAAPAANAITVSLPHFARGPEQAVNVPATSALGLPIQVSDGAGLTSLNFELAFDPGLLNVTAVSLVGGGTASLTPVSPGRVSVAITFAAPLVSGSQTVAYLTAAVPTSAASRYGEREALDVSMLSLTMSGGSVPGVDQDAVHVNTYFGDLGRNGRYDSFDVQQASRIAVRLDTGFQQHPLIDPVILADFNGNGRIDSFDVQRLSRLPLRLPVSETPVLPSPLPTTMDTDRIIAEEPPPTKTTAAVEPSPTPAALRSDVDESGTVDAQDVLWAIYYFNRSPNGELPAEAQGKKLDINGDNQFDSADILLTITDVNAQPRAAEGEATTAPASSGEADESAADFHALTTLLAEDLVAARKKK